MERPETHGELAFLLRLRKRLLAEFDKGTAPDVVLAMMDRLILEARAPEVPPKAKLH